MRKHLPFLAYALLVLVVFRGVLLPPEGKILFGPDITRYHYFQRGFLGRAIREGQIPWWNPYTFAGAPFLEHPQIPMWYPPNLLFILLPVNVAMSWYIALHLLLAMAGMYVLLRDISSFKLQASRLSAWAAGAAFGFSAYFVARIPAGHIDIIAASSWAPWVIAAFSALSRDEAGQKKHKQHPAIIGAGIALALQLLAGQPMVAVLTLEAVTIMTVVERGINGMARVAMAVALGMGLAAVQILPNAQYIAHSIRTFPFPQSWAQLGTPTIGHLLEFLDPFSFYGKLPDSGFGFEHVGYIGKVPLLFALLAILSLRRTVLPFCLVALFSLWMWLGNNAPFDLFSWVRSWLPLYGHTRIPARHIVLFVVSMSALSGLGLSMVKSKTLQLLAVALVLADLVPLARRHLALTSVPEAAEDRALVATLANDRGLVRFLPNFYHGESLRESLEFNAPTAHRIFSVSGYDTPPLRNYYEFLLAVNGYQFQDVTQYSESIPPFRDLTSPYLDFLNVKYVLTSAGLIENEGVLPRFFLATNLYSAAGRDAVLAALKQGSADPRTTVIVDGSRVDTSVFSPNCAGRERGDVKVLSYQYGEIRLRAATPCNAFLATSEVMYPGWTATIDGKPARLFESNAAFRTLYVPSGTHEIVFSYRPAIVLIGLAMSLGSLGAIAFAARRGI